MIAEPHGIDRFHIEVPNCDKFFVKTIFQKFIIWQT